MKTKPGLVRALVTLGAAVLVSRLPLFNVLGYEFSVAAALVASLVSASAAFSRLKAGSAAGGEYSLSLLRASGESLFLLLIPLAVISLNAFFVKNCSFMEGLAFYALIPGVTALFSVALAGFCRVTFRRHRTAYAACLAALFAYPLVLGYATPGIASYQFVYGFFPGFSYDDVVSLTPQLLHFRLITLAAAAFLAAAGGVVVAAAWSGDPPRRKISALVMPAAGRPAGRLRAAAWVLGAVLVVEWLLRQHSGFEASSAFIRESLGGAVSTEHFDIWYSPASMSEDEARWAGAEHEFRLAQVERSLEVRVEGRIGSYIYPDEETKRTFMGAGATSIAKPWRKEIHLNASTWRDVLRHEIAHVAAGSFGMPVIRAHYNIGLVEGLATAVDGEFGNRTLDEYAAAVIRFGILRDARPLVSPAGFALQSSSLSYVLMGSFCRHLMGRYGMDRFKRLYGGSPVESVYGEPYDSLAAEWELSLDSVVVPGDFRGHVEFYFRRPSIFAKECARAVAALNEKGWRDLSRNSPNSAAVLFSSSLERSWNTEAFLGLVRAAFQRGKYSDVVLEVDAGLRDPARAPGILSLLTLYGDALWARGNADSARRMFEWVRRTDIAERLTQGAAARLAALADPELGRELTGFFTGSLDDTSSLALLRRLSERTGSPLCRYLRARVLFQEKKYGEAIPELVAAGTFSDPTLEAARGGLLARAWFYGGEFDSARACFSRSMETAAGTAARDRLRDWIERCEWYAAHEVRVHDGAAGRARGGE